MPACALAAQQTTLDGFHLGKCDGILAGFCRYIMQGAFLLLYVAVTIFRAHKKTVGTRRHGLLQVHKDRERQYYLLPTVQKRVCGGISSMSGLLESGQTAGAESCRDMPRGSRHGDSRDEQCKIEHYVLPSNRTSENIFNQSCQDRQPVGIYYPQQA